MDKAHSRAQSYRIMTVGLYVSVKDRPSYLRFAPDIPRVESANKLASTEAIRTPVRDQSDAERSHLTKSRCDLGKVCNSIEVFIAKQR